MVLFIFINLHVPMQGMQFLTNLHFLLISIGDFCFTHLDTHDENPFFNNGKIFLKNLIFCHQYIFSIRMVKDRKNLVKLFLLIKWQKICFKNEKFDFIINAAFELYLSHLTHIRVWGPHTHFFRIWQIQQYTQQ